MNKYTCSLVQDKSSIKKMLDRDEYKAYKFTDVFDDITSKGRKIKTDDYLESGDYPIIDQGSAFISGYLDDNTNLLKDFPLIIFGDHTRCLKYIDFPIYLGADGVKVLKNKLGEDKAYTRFLYYYMKNIDIPNTGYNRHYKYLKEVLFVLPPLETQKKIVEALDKAQVLIDARKEQIRLTDELVKSQFIEMFGDLKYNNKNWKLAKFTELASIDTNMVKDFEKYSNYPHIGIDSIEKETGELKGYRTVKEDGVISGKYLFSSAHIIYSKIRPNLNKVALPDFEGVCSADAYPILPNKGISNREFLAYTMRSKFFLNYILAFSSRTNLPKVNKIQVEGFEVPLPPIEVQNEFAKFVRLISNSKLEMLRSLAELEKNFEGLMYKSFN